MKLEISIISKLNHKKMLDGNFHALKRLATENPTEKITITDVHKIPRERKTTKLLTYHKQLNPFVSR